MSQIRLIIYASIAALLLAGATGLYVKGRSDAAAASQIADLKSDLALANDRLKQYRDQTEKLNAVVKQHNDRAIQDAMKMSGIERQKEIILNEKHRDNECIDPSDTDRLREFFATTGAVATGSRDAGGSPDLLRTGDGDASGREPDRPVER